MGRISEAWPSLTSPGAIASFGLPFDFFVLVHKLKSQVSVESEPRAFALWLLAQRSGSFRMLPSRMRSEPVLPGGCQMEDHIYKVLELVGSSDKSIEDAIQNAITRASKTLREMKWFEVLQTRGHIEKGSVRHYQVTLKVGFTLED